MTKEQYYRIHHMSLPVLGKFYMSVRLSGDIALIRDLILNDRFFLLTQVLDVEVAWHPWVLARCREVEEAPDEHLDLWSRGHFKSTIITFAGVTQYVLKNPNKCVCILSYKSGAAQAFLQQIMTAFETKEILLKCFPDILYPERKNHQGDHWSSSDGIVLKRNTSKKESTIDVSGLISGMKTGGHYDLLVYDDTVTYESVGTPEMIERTTAAWSMSLNLGTVGETKHWYIGTRYSVCDTYAHMLKTGTITERRHICHDDEGRPVLLPQAEYNKKKREMTSKDWASQMLQMPVGDGELMFERRWFKTWRDGDLPERMNYYLFVDTALKKKKGSDYTVMMVIGFGSDGRKYVIDFIRDKLKLSEKTAMILELAERWRPSVIFWEENASVEGGEHIAEVLEKRGWAGLEFFAFRQPTSISKEDRIGKLEPDFRAGNIIFPYDRWYKGYDGMERDLVQDFLNDEYLVMTMAGAPSHDDMLDCLANIENAELLKKIVWPIAPRREPEGGGLYRKRKETRKGSSLFGR